MSAPVLCPPSSLTVRSIASFHDQLRSALAGGDEITIDLSPVEAPDLSVVQLVEAARRQATRDGKVLTLASPASGPLADLLERAGFSGMSLPDTQFWFHGAPTR